MGLFSRHSLQSGDNHRTTLLENPLFSGGYESTMNWETGKGQLFEYFVYGAACSEVEIDCLRGAHKVSTNGGCSGCTLDPPKPHISHLPEHPGGTICLA